MMCHVFGSWSSKLEVFHLFIWAPLLWKYRSWSHSLKAFRSPLMFISFKSCRFFVLGIQRPLMLGSLAWLVCNTNPVIGLKSNSARLNLSFVDSLLGICVRSLLLLCDSDEFCVRPPSSEYKSPIDFHVSVKRGKSTILQQIARNSYPFLEIMHGTRVRKEKARENNQESKWIREPA